MLTIWIVQSRTILNTPPKLQVISGAPVIAVAESGSKLQSSRGAWGNLKLLRSTGEGYQSVREVCVWLPDQFTFCWWGSSLQLFEAVLSWYNEPMHLLQKPSHPYIHPLAEPTKVGLPHPVAKLLQGEFRLLHADRGVRVGPTHLRRIIAFVICIEFIKRNIW